MNECVTPRRTAFSFASGSTMGRLVRGMAEAYV